MKDSIDMSRPFSKHGNLRPRKQRITPGDWVILCLLLALSILSFYLLHPGNTPGGEVWVYLKGKPYGFYPLDSDRIVRVKGPIGTTVISIHDREAAIISAPCPYKFCEKMGPIPHHGRVMICIPNRIIVEVKRKKRRGPDAITR